MMQGHRWFQYTTSRLIVVAIVVIHVLVTHVEAHNFRKHPWKGFREKEDRVYSLASFHRTRRIKGGFTSVHGRRRNVSKLPWRKRPMPSAMTVSSWDLSDPSALYKKYHQVEKKSLTHLDKLKGHEGDLVNLPLHFKDAVPQDSMKKGTQQNRFVLPRKLDMALAVTYFCNAIVFTLPVVLVPMLAAEAQGATSSVASLCAAVASMAALGGACGKFINGFVCQAVGGSNASILYLLGLALCCLVLSCAPIQSVAWTVAGMEFFASIQWTACSVLLSNHYKHDHASFAHGITILSFASTAGALLSKLLGALLLQRFHWRGVARLGFLVALVGAVCMKAAVREFPVPSRRRTNQQASNHLDVGAIASSLKDVLGSRVFWQVGIAHAMAFLARTSDRVLGSFFLEATNLPQYICGGLTVSVTLGFVHGLMTGNIFHRLKDTAEQTRLLIRRYVASVVSALMLALCANKAFASLFSPTALAVAAAFASGAMASSLSFQFYHLPPTVSKSFGDNQAVCLSFLDGIGFFLAAPIWAITGRIVSLGTYGWSVAWTLLAVLFATGGMLMMNTIPPILHKQNNAAAAASP